MNGVYLKLVEWMRPSPQLLASVALVAFTVLITVPVTVSIQSARNVVTTLDSVVISQVRLERTLNSVFDGLDARLRVQDRDIEKIRGVLLRSNEVHREIILDHTFGKPEWVLYDEKLRGLRRYEEDQWGDLKK